MDINQHLVTLEKSGIIRLDTAQPDVMYLFSHALYHDAAYHSVLKRDRKELHLLVGETLERKYPDRLEELAPVLGSHFLEGGDTARAIRYLKLAADRAFGRYANMEAAQLYAKTLELVKQKAEWDSQEIIYLSLRRGRALEVAGDYHQAQTTYLEMEADARARTDSHLLLAALTARTIILSIPSQAANPELGAQLGQEALQLARQLGDHPAEGKILWCLMLAYSFLNRTREAKDAGEASLKIARETQDREQIAYTLNDLGSFVYSGLGMYRTAVESLQEAYPIWKELRDLPMLTDNLISTALSLYYSGEFETAIEKTKAADEISIPLSLHWAQAYATGVRGIVLLETGRMAEAIQALEHGIYLSERGGFAAGKIIGSGYLSFMTYYLGPGLQREPLGEDIVAISLNQFTLWAPQALACVAYHHLVKGDLEKTAALLDEAEKVALITENIWYSLILPVVKCEYYLRQSVPDQLVAFIEDVLPNLEAESARTMLAYVYYYLGSAYLAMGQLEVSRVHFKRAVDTAGEIGAVHPLWRAHYRLAEIFTRQGQADASTHHRDQAVRTIRYISAHLGDPGLIEAFFQNPEVQALLVQ